jgi:hypothetical protein
MIGLSTVVVGGCSSDGTTPAGQGDTGGSSDATGGTSTMGGTAATAGTATNGGTTSTGGAAPANGGAPGSTGGTVTTDGGTTATGGTGATVSCPGCAALYVPLAAASTGADFEKDYTLATPANLSNSIITVHLQVVTAGNAGGLQLYAKNQLGAGTTDDPSAWPSQYGGWANFTAATTFVDVILDLSTVAAAPVPNTDKVFDKSLVRWIGINVTAGDAWSGANWQPVTVYVDSITFSDGATPDLTFDTTVEGFAVNTYNSPVTGSTVTWVGP